MDYSGGLTGASDTERASMATASESKTTIPVPVTCLRSLLEEYTRQAEQTINVCMFECLCWTESSRETTKLGQSDPNVYIPFVVSMEIGVFVQAEVFSKQIGLATDPKKPGEAQSIVPTFTNAPNKLKVSF